MIADVKMTGSLYAEILRDLRRPHPFAAERNGFVLARVGSGAAGSKIILCTSYYVIPDDHYVKDLAVGARIGPQAMTWAMQAAYAGRQRREGVFHVHLHEHCGKTGMSGIDRDGLPPMIPGFQSVGKNAPHGIIIFSLDHGAGWVWLTGHETAVRARRIAVIGAPIAVFESGKHA